MKLKTAQEWQEELQGETSIKSIEEFQVNAMLHAMYIARVAIDRVGYSHLSLKVMQAILESVPKKK